MYYLNFLWGQRTVHHQNRSCVKTRTQSTHLGTCGPGTGTGATTRGRRWTGPAAGWRTARADCAMRRAGALPAREAGPPGAPARRGWAGGRPPRRRPGPGWRSRPRGRRSGSRSGTGSSDRGWHSWALRAGGAPRLGTRRREGGCLWPLKTRWWSTSWARAGTWSAGPGSPAFRRKQKLLPKKKKKTAQSLCAGKESCGGRNLPDLIHGRRRRLFRRARAGRLVSSRA